jgi:hypothetical protein
MPQQSTKGDKHTLIEQGTEFKGTMKSTCAVVVNGSLEGDLSAPELDVTATGRVQGNIKAERLSSRGVLSGNIDAGDLFLSGSVGSKTVIKAKNLEVKLSPEQGRMELTFGECTLDVGDEPTKERRAEPTATATSTLSAISSHQLPVTKSSPPVRLPYDADKPGAYLVDTAASDVPVEAKDRAAPSNEPGDGSKPVKGSAAGGPSKQPQSKKAGARDSVPPGS